MALTPEALAILLARFKTKLSISINDKDDLFKDKINATVSIVENQLGTSVDETDPEVLDLITDIAEWLYNDKGEAKAIPRNFTWRLHNMICKIAATPEE